MTWVDKIIGDDIYEKTDNANNTGNDCCKL